MICPQCHSPNPDSADACSFCGAERVVTKITRLAGFDETASLVIAVEKHQPRKIAGRYALVSFLGRGDAGVVFRALDEKLGEEVALKVLLPGLTTDPAEIARLKREVVTARKITHPNVIRLHDFGEEGGSAFLSMELLSGGTLFDRMQRAPLSPREAIELAIGIADGLGAAHAQGVVHRDVKPHNVLLDARGVVKLADFGLARLTVATTRTVGFAGTPQYMSPETIDDNPATSRSDVYSLGVLLFEMLTGRLPFMAETLIRLALMHMNDPPPRPSSLKPEITWDIDQVVLRALEKDPLRRWADGSEMAAALRLLLIAEATGPTNTGSGTPTESPTLPPAPAVEDDVEHTRAVVTTPGTMLPRAAVTAVTAPLVPRAAVTAVTAPILPRTAVTAVTAPLPPPRSADAVGEPAPRRRILPEKADSLADAEAARRRSALVWSTVFGILFAVGLWWMLSAPSQPLAAATATPDATASPAGTAARVAEEGTSTLTVHAWPRVAIWVDNEKIGETKVLRNATVRAGDHVVRVRNDSAHFEMEKTVHFDAGKEIVVRVDQRDGSFEVISRSPL